MPARHRVGRRPGAAAGPGPAEDILQRAGGGECESNEPFRFLREAESEKLSRLLGGERPQTIALVLSHLPPQQAGSVLARLQPALQAEVVRRLVDLEETAPEILREVEEALESRFAEQVQMQRRRVAGLAAVTGILQAADGRTGMQILDNLANHDHSLAERLRPQPLAFDDLANVEERILAAVVRAADAKVLMTALIGAAAELVDRILGGLSPAEAAQARHQLDHPGPLRLRDVEEARQQIARLAQCEMPRRPSRPLLHPLTLGLLRTDMATVIRATDAKLGTATVAFNFDDMAAEAQGRFHRVRAEAVKIVARAQQESGDIRRRAELEGRQAAGQALDQVVQKHLATVLPALGRVIKDIDDAKQAWLTIGSRASCNWRPPSPSGSARRIDPAAGNPPEAGPRGPGVGRRQLADPHPPPSPGSPDVGGARADVGAGISPLAGAELVADEGISRGGCRVETRFGAIDQQFEAQLARIEEELTEAAPRDGGN